MGQNHIFLKMTYRQMVKNKVRTLVTIIGIMLSAALITAITVFIASLHKSMLDYKIKESGNWYGVIEQVDLKEGLEKIRQDSDILSERLMYNRTDIRSVSRHSVMKMKSAFRWSLQKAEWRKIQKKLWLQGI